MNVKQPFQVAIKLECLIYEECNVEKKLDELKARLSEINDLNMATAVLYWDQSTYMPPGGAEARGRQLATVGRIAHEKFTDPAIGRLLDPLQIYAETLPYDSDEASLIRVTRRDYERAIKVPPALQAEIFEQATASYQAWTEARPNNDFAKIRPFLEKTLDLSRQYADCFPGYKHIADPLIDAADEGQTAESTRAIFFQLRAELVPLVKIITSQETADDSCLKQYFPEQEQLAFGQACIRDYGYDFERGRQDKTPHPFMINFSIGDVRITTRVDEEDLNNALFSTLHEAGHALYEQGINGDLEGGPLAGGTSAGVHESQSRLWENQIGRSREFWSHYYPKLQAQFPDQLGTVSLDSFYRAIHKVERSLIRTEADEVTYNLHVMIRFDLELALLEGSLAVKDLPEAWHARYESDLGLRAPSDVDGVLQDVHWYSWQIGGQFQGYTLGNIMSAAFFDAALKDHPQIPSQVAQGEFGTLLSWLQENIYQHGRKFTANELVERVTGGPLTIDPYIRYLRSKYGEIFAL
jgi:carboxypeptidase Taq